MEVVVKQEGSLPPHQCHTCVGEARLDVCGGRSDTTTAPLQENMKALFLVSWSLFGLRSLVSFAVQRIGTLSHVALVLGWRSCCWDGFPPWPGSPSALPGRTPRWPYVWTYCWSDTASTGWECSGIVNLAVGQASVLPPGYTKDLDFVKRTRIVKIMVNMDSWV